MGRCIFYCGNWPQTTFFLTFWVKKMKWNDDHLMIEQRGGWSFTTLLCYCIDSLIHLSSFYGVELCRHVSYFTSRWCLIDIIVIESSSWKCYFLVQDFVVFLLSAHCIDLFTDASFLKIQYCTVSNTNNFLHFLTCFTTFQVIDRIISILHRLVGLSVSSSFKFMAYYAFVVLLNKEAEAWIEIKSECQVQMSAHLLFS